MTVDRIVSGGQTGVDRAALDFAMQRGIPCGGWCPRRRLAEDGPIDARYPLQETSSDDYAQRTEWNVRDSDGTLILSWGPPSDGTAFTIQCAEDLGKPCFVVDVSVSISVSDAISWISSRNIRVLNVAGTRASKAPDAYQAARAFLDALLAKA